MKGYVLKRYHIDLDMGDLDDEDRDNLLAGIEQTAPQSALYAGNTAIQASYTALVKKAAALKTARDLVSADEQKLAADKGACNVARSAFDTELLMLAGLTSNNATSTADLSSMGFTPRGPAAPKPPFVGADQLDFKFTKGVKGQVTVTPHVPRTDHSKWAAQTATDPNGVWTDVYGTGKSRIVTGKSGTLLWVRFARVRGSQTSAWGTAISVTLP